MVLFWLGVAVLCSAPVSLALVLTLHYFYLRWKYLHLMVRIFQEKPLFVVPRGQPVPEAEDVRFPTDGRPDAGRLLPQRGGAAARRHPVRAGVRLQPLVVSCRIANTWSAAGYDVFAFESRSQGDSDRQPGYEPLQWVTDFEVRDAAAALAYLKGRPDADPRGVGFFGISKGAGAGLLAAGRDPYVRCCVTDGVFGIVHHGGAVHAALVPHLQQSVSIAGFDPVVVLRAARTVRPAADRHGCAAAASRTWSGRCGGWRRGRC